MNTGTMKNSLQRKKYNLVVVEQHVEPPPTPLIKIKRGEKLELYGFKMALFHNGKPEEFLLFVPNFNMTIEASGVLQLYKKAQYFRALVRK